MYLYKKLDAEGNMRGTVGCMTPQPASERLVEIDKEEFDTIQEKMKTDEQIALDASGPTRIEALEARIVELEKN